MGDKKLDRLLNYLEGISLSKWEEIGWCQDVEDGCHTYSVDLKPPLKAKISTSPRWPPSLHIYKPKSSLENTYLLNVRDNERVAKLANDLNLDRLERKKQRQENVNKIKEKERQEIKRKGYQGNIDEVLRNLE